MEHHKSWGISGEFPTGFTLHVVLSFIFAFTFPVPGIGNDRVKMHKRKSTAQGAYFSFGDVKEDVIKSPTCIAA